MCDKNKGLYNKYTVLREDSSSKHSECEYFVLDMNHDIYAIAAIKAYAEACKDEYPFLANDLVEKYLKNEQ